MIHAARERVQPESALRPKEPPGARIARFLDRCEAMVDRRPDAVRRRLQRLLPSPLFLERSSSGPRAVPTELGRRESFLERRSGLAHEHPPTAVRFYTRALRCVSIAGEPRLLARTLHLRGGAYGLNEEHGSAIRDLEEAVRLYGEVGDLPLQARARLGLGGAQAMASRDEEALGTLHLARRQFIDTGDWERVAAAETNLGNAHNRQERFGESIRSLQMAKQLLLALGRLDRAGRASSNLASSLLERGMLREALEEGAWALQALPAEDRFSRSLALLNVARVPLEQGQATEAIRQLEQAQGGFREEGLEKHAALVDYDLADAYWRLHDFARALRHARRALEILERFEGLEIDQGRALETIGEVLTELGRHAEAEEALARASEMFVGAHALSRQAIILLRQAVLRGKGGDPATGLQLARQALEFFQDRDVPHRALEAMLVQADLLASLGRGRDSHDLYERVCRSADPGTAPWLRFRALEGLGWALLAERRPEEAERRLREASEVLERLRQGVGAEDLRSTILRGRETVYQGLVLALLSRDRPDAATEALVVVDSAKARTMADLLLEGLWRSGVWAREDPVLSELLKEMEAASSLLRRTERRLTPAGAAEMERLLREVAESRIRVEERVQRLETAMVPPAAGRPVRDLVERALGALPRDTVVLAFYVLEGRYHVFVVSEGRARPPIALLGQEEAEDRLAKLQFYLAGEVSEGPEREADGPRRAREATLRLQRLYRLLLAPAERYLEGARRLVVLPHAALHDLPFEALHDGDRHLGERFPVSYVPSLASLTLIAESRAPRAGRTAVFASEGKDGRIPRVRDEADEIRRLVPGAGLFLSREATRAAFLRRAEESDVLHVACHATFPTGAPNLAELQLWDGPLLLLDLRSVRLPGSLVVLSACRTGESEVGAGDELRGFSRAFLAAGARAVVVSRWHLADEDGLALMRALYRELRAGTSVEEGARRAVADVRRKRPHPFHWAGLAVHGEGSHRPYGAPA